MRLGNLIYRSQSHYSASDDDNEVQRRPRNDPANSLSVHPSWWNSSANRYGTRIPPVEETSYDVDGEAYPLYQHETVRPNYIPLSSDEERQEGVDDETADEGEYEIVEYPFPDDQDSFTGFSVSEGSDSDNIDRVEPYPAEPGAYLAGLWADNWQHVKKQFSSFNGAVLFIGRVLIRIFFNFVVPAQLFRRRAG